MATITPESYAEFLRRRLDAIQETAGFVLNQSKTHRWSKNLGKKDRMMIDKMERDLRHIIRYSSIEQLQEVQDGTDNS